MTDQQLHIISSVGTVFVALCIVIGFRTFDVEALPEKPKSDRFANAQTIEAALAFKKPKTEKKRQPQKKKKKKFKPSDQKASRDDKRDPVEKKEQKKKEVLPDEIDILSKNRKLGEQDDNLSDTGEEVDPDEGSADGSEWGTEGEAKGDPYVGELKGRIYKVWTVPSFEKGRATALGCVKLDAKGRIVDRSLEKRSSNANLNTSVEVALKKASDMEAAVPAKLVKLLTEKGICFRFSLSGK